MRAVQITTEDDRAKFRDGKEPFWCHSSSASAADSFV